MFDWLREKSNKLKSLFGWLIDGYPEKHPITGEYVSTRREQIQTVLRQGIHAVYSLLRTILLDILAVPVEFVVGVATDFYHSDRRHTRNLALTLFSIVAYPFQFAFNVLRDWLK